jgi:biopolymer transport protein ExbB/TolQ
MLVPVLISVSVAAVLVLLVILVLVFMNLARLAKSMEVLNREVLPMTERLQREAEEVRRRLDSLDERAETLREAAERRPGRRAQRSTGFPRAQR